MDKLVAGQRGRVVVAAPLVLSATFLARTLAQFRSRHPGIEQALNDSLPDEVLPQVWRGGSGHRHFRRTEDDLDKMLLFREALVAVFPRDHRFARRTLLTLRDLANEQLVSLPRGNVFSELAASGFVAAGMHAEPAFEARYVGTAIGLVKAGLGVAIVPGQQRSPLLPRCWRPGGRCGKRRRKAAPPFLEPTELAPTEGQSLARGARARRPTGAAR